MIVRLHLQSPPASIGRGLRLGWLFVSLSLLVMAGFFLYPVVESFTESQPAPPSAAKPPAKAIVKPPAAPAPPDVVVKAPAKRAANRPLAAQVAVAAKAVREVAPRAPEGIRNRIQGVIPVDVVVRVGGDGGVVSAHAPAQHDPVRSYFAEQ